MAPRLPLNYDLHEVAMTDRIDLTSQGTLDVLTARPERASTEESATGQGGRPEFSAESLSTQARIALLLLTLLGAALTATTIIAAIAWHEGVFRLGIWGAAIVGGVFTVVWLLQALFGALLENNRALGRGAHVAWIAAFMFTGPFGLLLYWMLHVWPAGRKSRHGDD